MWGGGVKVGVSEASEGEGEQSTKSSNSWLNSVRSRQYPNLVRNVTYLIIITIISGGTSRRAAETAEKWREARRRSVRAGMCVRRSEVGE